MTSRSRSLSLDSSVDDEYFFKTYVPLSNLPTPPLGSSSNPASRRQSAEVFLTQGEILDADLLGPATHLTNLIPSSTSLTTPSVPLVHVMLTRAELPLEIVALAVCILDSLNSRFALSWRQGLPLVTPHSIVSLGRIEEHSGKQHIDSVQPELIVLAALVLAVKFLDDRQQTTRQYASLWGNELWTCDQLNFTQRSILENLGYRLLPIWEESIITEALEDMHRAGRQAFMENNEDWDTEICFGGFGSEGNRGHRGYMKGGKPLMGLGDQITPAETPMAGSNHGTKGLPQKTKYAFQHVDDDGSSRENRQYKLPTRSSFDIVEELFPSFDDPILRGMGCGFR
ncbi:hypothetical protein BJ875DRAFT_445979 [Amylocarpus encephaloides]|uniref:Cyclin N-terminal domain-containing protein n=1 Tax=Amylocarpus encephaloides TaxID=45428 RepID=A0A9P7Y957_9HELO|nr:hypothetical protein BJ875DRAFT_445979 [Amylocarpus encephaloides]